MHCPDPLSCSMSGYHMGRNDIRTSLCAQGESLWHPWRLFLARLDPADLCAVRSQSPFGMLHFAAFTHTYKRSTTNVRPVMIW